GLSGRVALVTRASSGIGAATATLLAELGAGVAIGYFNNEQGAHATRDDIGKAGGKAIAVRSDVRSATDVAALVERTAAELGPIDILVNNAGSLLYRMKLLETDEARWNDVFSLNLTSAMLCARAVAPGMIERKR